MPGVPSGRGCDACRKQKKKCDLSTHPCPRCRRLDIPCIGLGQQRYKFVKAEGSSCSLVPARPQTRTVLPQTHVFRSLSNEHTQRVSAFTDKINPLIGVKFNLAWTYGDYLVDVPARLGTNEALDKAADTLLAALQRYSSPAVEVTLLVLEKYTLALAALRMCLDDPVTARSCETLAAIVLLLSCQQFLWKPTRVSTAHSEGAAQILRLRGRPGTCEPFERNLLLALRGVVLLQSLFSDNIIFTDREWLEVFETGQDQDTLSPEGRAIQCLTRAPNLMRRAKAALIAADASESHLMELRDESQRLRDDLEPHLTTLRQRLGVANSPTVSNDPNATVWLDLRHCHFLRSYSLGLAMAIIINEIVIAVTGDGDGDASPVLQESELFSGEIVRLAHIASQYRPLGASSLGLCLIAAEIGASDPGTKSAARQLRLEYETDFHAPDARTSTTTTTELQLICGRCTTRARMLQ
ncbi:hypothetical protein A1O3_05660 [Capronia epimyces CBS 606.96]|uniref:Zn(2)-C6 fungal-type domain-containing protein n=1 Tax=Capronia epimyces CBS 606.96 TaxID=1182542 RepID=W9Y5T0_9EURO|nr:uncharacterized protein A1O3_05660 [Capronia epimyces CBS 606.96]EXJ84985.1 hypothetical protein A1O3_05660 [Capronia epimyces CBS 606.96]